MMNEKQRATSRFLIKQRLFIKLYLLKYIEDGRLYGIQMLEQIRDRFQSEGYKPNHADIYRALHELVDSGVIKASKRKLTEDSYQEILIYYIRDTQKAAIIKEQGIKELKDSAALLKKALDDLED
ncbi:helix-turn-helix transcriptional regulator [Alkalicoccobacillus porphyridii]|uniref:Replication termination protein n=1 Tax=Alkalicoccobacillus porphyridii TaxID=2597270 RepID=A0A554A034_9BACI|nr:helix-turn-helix transcriptional regulator [Alkalicoccobacillus porphyridii]TSB47050.1 Replication termination protein [Alkalicoccobacillus porphyridii]